MPPQHFENLEWSSMLLQTSEFNKLHFSVRGWGWTRPPVLAVASPWCSVILCRAPLGTNGFCVAGAPATYWYIVLHDDVHGCTLCLLFALSSTSRLLCVGALVRSCFARVHFHRVKHGKCYLAISIPTIIVASWLIMASPLMATDG